MAAETLFQEAPRRPVIAVKAAVGVTAVLVGTMASLMRTTGAGALDTTHMEDAAVFLTDALTKSPIDALTTSYSGYFHLVPRVLAEVAAYAPASWAAAILAVEAALVTSLLALMVYTASAGLLPTTVQRLMVSIPMVAIPLAQSEMLNSVAMLRWQLIYATFWAILWVSPSRAGSIVGTSVIGLAAFSDNVVWLLLPLLVLRLRARRDLPRLIATGLLIAGSASHLLAMVTAASSRGVNPRLEPIWAIMAYALRPVPQSMVGARWVTERPEPTILGLLPVAAGWCVVGVIVLLALRKVTRPHWKLAMTAVVFSLTIYAFCVMVVGDAGPRYGAPAAMLVITALTALSTPQPTRAQATRWIPAVGLATLLVVVAAINFRVPGNRTDGPSWTEGIERAKAACVAGGVAAQHYPAQPHPSIPSAQYRIATVPVSPTQAGWSAHLPCDYLHQQ